MKYFLLLLPLLFFSACANTPQTPTVKVHPSTSVFHDKTQFPKGRPCTDVKFECLPESIDLSWQGEGDTHEMEQYEVTDYDTKHRNDLIKKYDDLEKQMGHYTVTEKDEAFFESVRRKNFIKEMESNLEKEFPGFWKDTPKKVRHRWIRLAMTKADKYGYNKSLRESNQLVELCARIGLNFDRDPKYKQIVDFISQPDSSYGAYAGKAVDYIDFTIFEKDYTKDKLRFTDWLLRDALTYLPYPNRPVPRLNQ